MKKILFLIIISFILTSCWFSSKKENVLPLRKNILVEDFYKTKIPIDSISSKDLKGFNEMIKNNKDYFVKIGDLEFFNIWRDFLFGDNYTSGEVQKLEDCFNGRLDAGKLSSIYKDICKGQNEYIKEGKFNFFHIKDTLLIYKKIKNGENFDCSYFLKGNYDLPLEQIIPHKETDYFTCKKIQDLKNYDLNKEFFYYKYAFDLLKCEYLEDKNLVKLCNEKVDEYLEKSKK